MTIFPSFELCVSIVCQFYDDSRKLFLRADITVDNTLKEIEKLFSIIKRIVNRISLGKLSILPIKIIKWYRLVRQHRCRSAIEQKLAFMRNIMSG